MPFYVYKCVNCDYEYKTFHGINDQLHDCVNCNSERTLTKIPQLLTANSEDKQKKMAGERVTRFIEDSRQLLKDHKEHLRKEEK